MIDDNDIGSLSFLGLYTIVSNFPSIPLGVVCRCKAIMDMVGNLCR
jgi:hypothetical protein